MIAAIYYSEVTGRAYQILSGPDLAGFPEAPPGDLALLLDSPAQLPGYVVGTSYVPLPSRPSSIHEFNWITKQWEDPRTLQDLKDEKWQAIKASRDAAEAGTFLWNGHTVDADKERINGAATGVLIAKGLGQVYSDAWTLADNSTIPVTGDDILSMGVSLVQHVSACHAHGRALRQQIEDAESAQEVDAVAWNL